MRWALTGKRQHKIFTAMVPSPSVSGKKRYIWRKIAYGNNIVVGSLLSSDGHRCKRRLPKPTNHWDRNRCDQHNEGFLEQMLSNFLQPGGFQTASSIACLGHLS